MKKKTFIIISVIVLLIIVMIAGKKMGWFGDQKKGKLVTVQKVERMMLTQLVSATGKIQPELEVKISSEVSGEVTDLPIKEGQKVKKGDLLVSINPDLYQSAVKRSVAGLENIKANLQQAEASLKESEQNYQRSKILFDKGVISKAEWDKATSSYNIAKANRESVFYSVKSAMANVTEAQDNLKRTNIYAPADGTISKLNIELGERVLGTKQMTGTEILRIANLKRMEVEVDVNENDIVKVNVGDSAVVEVDAYPKKEFKGIVTNIANTANATASVDQVTNFKVKVHILESSYQNLLEGKPEGYSPFRPGMTATIDIITEKKNDVLAVPISAIVIKTDTTSTRKSEVDNDKKSEERFECVFVKNGDKAKLQVVNTGIQARSDIEITSGLEENTEIITGPYNTVSKILENGDLIYVEKETKK